MAKKIKRYKVGLDSETYKISMVSEPAIEVDYVALSKDEEVQVKLSSDERHICYGPALIPNKDIYRNNGEQEFYINFSEESIAKMSQDFMRDYRQHEVNLQHQDNADEVFVCESWIVEDPYKDKANSLGLTVPRGTWMVAMKVNNIEVWDKVKSGELKGFSCESLIRLEEFSKNENNMNIETNEMFWTTLKNTIKEIFTSSSMIEKEEGEDIEPTNIDLEAETQTETVVETPTVEEPKVEEPKVEETVVEEPKVEEPKPQEEEPKVEEPKTDPHLEELINSLKEEVAALKSLNEGMNKKIKSLEKQPSAKPISTVGGNNGNGGNSQYSAWREQLRQML